VKSAREFRKFGFVLGGAFAVVSLLLFLRGGDAWRVTAAFSVLLTVTGILFPTLLRPLEWFWMRLALVMGFVVTNVLLTLVFLIAVTPTGLIMRMLGKDQLGMRRDGRSETYWKNIESDGPCSRLDKPY
jgi:hypothetical protein